LQLPALDRAKPRLAVVVGAAALVVLVPAYLFIAPRSVWTPEDLFVLLIAAGFVSFAAAAPLIRRQTLDAGSAAALIALVFLGPLPAALVFAAPEPGRWFQGLRTPIFVSNVASYGWALLTTSLLLSVFASGPPVELDASAYAAIVFAGSVLVVVNFVVTTLLGEVLYDGIRLRAALSQEFLPSSPVAFGLILVACATIFLYDEIGIAGLAPLALMLLLPRVLTPVLLKEEPVSRLPRSGATALYAEAIGDELDLDRRRKRIIADAASHLGGSASITRLEDFTAVMQTVLHYRERWDGTGGTPGVLSGAAIPLESRVLAVANAWSELTAEGTRELQPEQALQYLTQRAGEFDPGVVAAAVKTVRDQTLPFPS
jgi:HD domain